MHMQLYNVLHTIYRHSVTGLWTSVETENWNCKICSVITKLDMIIRHVLRTLSNIYEGAFAKINSH